MTPMKNNPWLDFHKISASRDLKKPIEEVTADEREEAKERNFWRLYSPKAGEFCSEMNEYLQEMAECRSDAFLAVQELKKYGVM